MDHSFPQKMKRKAQAESSFQVDANPEKEFGKEADEKIRGALNAIFQMATVPVESPIELEGQVPDCNECNGPAIEK